MHWEYFNPNPVKSIGVGDCTVRAVAKALGITWEDAYARLSYNGFLMGDIPNSDTVLGALLRENGFKREVVPNTCPECYTIEDFCIEHPTGTYVLKSDNHVATVKDGTLYDSWNSSENIPYYYWYLDTNDK